MKLLASRKNRTALAGILTTILVILSPKWGGPLSPEEAQAIAASIVALAGFLIHGVALEDAGAKAGGQKPMP